MDYFLTSMKVKSYKISILAKNRDERSPGHGKSHTNKVPTKGPTNKTPGTSKIICSC